MDLPKEQQNGANRPEIPGDGLAESGAGKSLRSMPKPLVLALLISAVLSLALASLTYGTNDILFFQSYAVKAANDGTAALYRDGAHLVAYHKDHVEFMAHPPAMLNLWGAILRLEAISGIPFHFWFRLLTAVAYLISIVFVWKLASARAAIYYALCPAAIMISGFHGNSDPLIVAALLAAIYAAECKDRPGMAGVAFGFAFSIKVWPLFLLLAFMAGVKTWRARIHFCLAAAAIVAVLAFPHILADPRLIVSKVMEYHSFPGGWGLSFSPEYVPIGIPVTFAAIAAAIVYLRVRNATLTRMVGTSIMLFLILTPGFGVQYLAWILPFCFLFGRQVIGGVYATSSIYLAATYTFWSGGIPWYFADSLVEHYGYGIVVFFGLLCWATLAASITSCLQFRNLAAARRALTRPVTI